MFKRLFNLFKRKDIEYIATSDEPIVDTIDYIDTSNYSDTLYNIYCSINGVKIGDRKKDYNDIILSLNHEAKIAFTNTIYKITLSKYDSVVDEFLSILRDYKIYYNINDKIIIFAMNMRQAELLSYLYLHKDNQILKWVFGSLLYPFDNRLYDLQYMQSLSNIDNHHEYKISNNISTILPLRDKDNIYVIENQLELYINDNNIGIKKVPENIFFAFMIVLAIDTSNKLDDLLVQYASDIITTEISGVSESERYILRFNLYNIKLLIESYTYYKKDPDIIINTIINIYNNLYSNYCEPSIVNDTNNIKLDTTTSDNNISYNSEDMIFIDGVDEEI